MFHGMLHEVMSSHATAKLRQLLDRAEDAPRVGVPTPMGRANNALAVVVGPLGEACGPL